MKLVILGAGASHGASRNGGVPAPLVNRILSTASQVGILDSAFHKRANQDAEAIVAKAGLSMDGFSQIAGLPDSGGHLEVLKTFVHEQMGVLPEKYEIEPVDFEKVFSLVEAELLGHHGLLRLLDKAPKGPSPSDILESQFMLVLCGSILAATRDLTCDYHDHLAQWLDPGDIVTSFNYDLLIDRSLRRQGRWHPDDGYCIPLGKLGTRKGEDVEWRDPREVRSDVLLLKPHGSLNWLYPVDSWKSMMHVDLFGGDVRTPEPKVYCLEDVFPRFEDDQPLYEWWERYDHSEGGYMYDMHALIVPPTLFKPYRDFEPLIGRLWAILLHALLFKVTELYLVGYSIRPDDARSWWLLRKVAAESATLRQVVVVDPSDAVYERATRALSPRHVSRGPRTLGEFAASL